jgi:hypothetical protein
MSFPAEKPFIPSVSKVVILDSSSGSPNATKDPKSLASLGSNLQAMVDQAQADTLYDVNKEGYTNYRYRGTGTKNTYILTALIAFTGIVFIVCSFEKGSLKKGRR